MKTALQMVADAKSRIREVPVEAADAAIAEATILIDVREPDEFRQGHLPGAINMPRGLLEFQLGANPACADADLVAVVYCKTSGRAALAAQTMQSMGYTNVRSISGGYDGWVAAGKPVVHPQLPDFG